MEGKRLSSKQSFANDKTFLQQWGMTFIILLFLVITFVAMGGLNSMGVWLDAVAFGISMSLVAVGVYLTFCILNFPNLTIDDSFVLGGSISATMLIAEYSPYVT